MNHDPEAHQAPPGFWRSRYAAGLLVLGAVAGYFLMSEHQAHFFGALPFLLLLVCPLMHIFMHHGHGKHRGGHAHHRGGEQGTRSPAPPHAQILAPLGSNATPERE